ncbi:hypothetical protein L218DRAFT_1006675 [Marasmius fiardii PR-910]|nr:hypothetical protein L218DRAFT_1006675 [Marasmius fiardii PR-910]
MNSQYGPQPGQPQHPTFNPRYMAQLANEMKAYTAEVMKFQDEIRRLKFEIDELRAWKDREMAGLPVEWLPPSLQPPLPPPAIEPPPLNPEDYEPARPAWRTVVKRPVKKAKQKAITGAASPLPTSPSPSLSPPPHGGMPGGFEMPGWAQWRPNPAYSPAPFSASPASPLPGGRGGPKPGLFGPDDD